MDITANLYVKNKYIIMLYSECHIGGLLYMALTFIKKIIFLFRKRVKFGL